MEINPKLNLDAFEASFHAIDTHTVGEFTRIITSGFPKLEGDTMIERKNFLAEHYDKYRQALMFEPRGHHDMFGALLTDPIHPEADFGVIFMDTGEYLNMCGHGTIGSVTAIIETGLVPAVEPYTEVVLDAPAGIIRTKAEVKNGKVLNVTLTNVPAFLYKENLTTEVDGREVHYDISFGGSFFGDHMADRSPCGTGTSAKLATLYKKGEIKVGQPFVYESFIGSQFKGVILDTTKVADYDAVIPQITGSAYLTGEATYVIDPDDPLKYGFKVGR